MVITIQLDSPQLAAGTLRLGILKGSQRRLPLSRRRANLVRAGEILLGNIMLAPRSLTAQVKCVRGLLASPSQLLKSQQTPYHQ